jgi:hypothetical protein
MIDMKVSQKRHLWDWEKPVLVCNKIALCGLICDTIQDSGRYMLLNNKYELDDYE